MNEISGPYFDKIQIFRKIYHLETPVVLSI